ncbi:MAG: hypothetical protein ABSF35_24145, partial [Polyangia bacterium]
GLSLYATAPSPINVSPNPENCVLPITNIREKQPVELREKRQKPATVAPTNPSGRNRAWA